MFYPDILIAGLGNFVLYRRDCTEKRERGGILLLDEDMSLQAAPLYIGSWKDIPKTVPEDCCIFCSEGADYEGDYDTICPSCRNLILFDLRTTRLYNEVSTRYRQYILWRSKLDHSRDLDEMTRLASTASGYPVAIVDSFFQTMAIHAVTEPNSSVFHALLQEKALSQNTAEYMLSSERSSHYANKLFFTFEEQLVEDYLIRYDNRSIARILVEQTPGVDPVLAQHYIDDFLRAARPLVQSHDDLKKMSMNAISTLIADLIDLRVTDPEELERRRLLLLAGAQPNLRGEVCAQLPGLDEELLIRAGAALDAGDGNRCVQLLEACENWETPEWNLLRAEAYLAEKEYGAALACFRKAEAVFESVCLPKMELCCKELGDFQGAYGYACRQRG